MCKFFFYDKGPALNDSHMQSLITIGMLKYNTPAKYMTVFRTIPVLFLFYRSFFFTSWVQFIEQNLNILTEKRNSVFEY